MRWIRALRVAEVERSRELKDAGIRACYFLQFGYPGEGWEDIEQTIELVRDTRPDDIGVSFSYPLPGTAFFDRVQAQIGSKRNWTDSDDLCLMFTARTQTSSTSRYAMPSTLRWTRGTATISEVATCVSLWRQSIRAGENQQRV